MPQIAKPTPLVMKDAVMTIAADSYEKHLSGVRFEPATSVITWQGLTPDATFTDVAGATWTCVLAYAQDWSMANSLSRYLFDNEGKAVEATFRPKRGEGPSFAATVTITPGTIGGDVNATAVATVTLGSDRPELVANPPA